jgi:hypothetical protein
LDDVPGGRRGRSAPPSTDRAPPFILSPALLLVFPSPSRGPNPAPLPGAKGSLVSLIPLVFDNDNDGGGRRDDDDDDDDAGVDEVGGAVARGLREEDDHDDVAAAVLRIVWVLHQTKILLQI